VAHSIECLHDFSSTYEVRGMMELVTSYDNATVGSGTPLNQVKLTYNEFTQLTQESQDHGGTVSLSSPNVQYVFASGGSSSNQVRPTTLTYPNSRAITMDYGMSNATNDRLNRLEAIKDGTLSLAAYTYLGTGTVVQINYSQPGVMLDLWGGTTQVFNGMDRFGRIAAHPPQRRKPHEPASLQVHQRPRHLRHAGTGAGLHPGPHRQLEQLSHQDHRHHRLESEPHL
jgi:hypothetical protein